jgi:hypothetical protein
MYTLQFFQTATVTVRRLAWVLGLSMPKAVDKIINEIHRPRSVRSAKTAQNASFAGSIRQLQKKRVQKKPRKHRSNSRRLRQGRGSLHFQVYAEFTLTRGKPQLVSTSMRINLCNP